MQDIRVTTESPKAAIAIFGKGTKIIFEVKFVRSQLHVGYVFVSSIQLLKLQGDIHQYQLPFAGS